MTHAWLNLLAVLFSGFMGMGSTDTKQDYSEPAEYAVIERISDTEATLETPNGRLTVPLTLLPRLEHPEGEVLEIRRGDVLEIRVDPEERNRRLASGNARLHRMRTASSLAEL
ncbi:MAG: DUF3006 domain-containing protein [Proteobacteria bacterium]|nr:DUF3006 domain-containing protein [Pseudomonadota bacterium]